ncbi:BTAD domain-containing putative transcriptional regulator [Mycobacterium sp. NPDC050551]|uniref:BTAD domain-containing putative transcriptional regulator n=1 Tax=Mycobacterium sp. NPDC050551 TaxID=3155407 RepID=UPI00341272C8
MGVHFRLLGEVEARVDGDGLDIGHARQRCVLACLLVDLNRPVSTDQLIERVWADEPPHRARNALAAYVSRLRHALAGADAVHIARGTAGYTLNAAPESVDLHRFRNLVGAARAAEHPGDALAAFDDAMALWTGEPFAGLDTPWVNEVRAALETELLSATLDRNDAALRAGRHTALLAELSAAATAHPLDERIAGQLMLAQSRSGRQAAALQTYRRMRARLVAELGVEPGPALEAVHREILAGTTAPAPQAASAPRPEPARPTARRATRFIGRTRELAAITGALQAGAALTLTGVGGVGKTRLALEAADRADGFPDGVRTCELAPLDDGSAVGRAVAAALGLPQGSGTAVATVVDHLRPRRLLLVVDNCEHVLAAAAELVDRITRECAGIAVLATSRESLGIEGERLLPVEPLPEGDATALFADRARAIRPDFDLDTEPIGAVAEICRRLDGVPLAIELAAARLRAMSSLDVARRLDRLRLLSGGARGAHPRQQSVAATIDWSYRLLAEREQTLFDRLSVFAGSFDLEAVHGVCAEPADDEDDTLELLTGLVDKSMVVAAHGGAGTRYSVLETLRAYGRDRLRGNATHENDAGDRYAARHATYFTELAERGATAMHGPDEQAWIERMAPTAGTTFTSPDHDNLRTAFERAMADGDTGLALRLVASLPELMHMRVGYTSMDWVDRAIESADPAHPLFAAAVGVSARGAWVLGRFSHALALAALADGHVPDRGHSYLGYPGDIPADVAVICGDPAAALAYYLEECAVARDAVDAPRMVWNLYNSTVAHDVLGVPEAGLAAAQEAVRLARTTGNPSTMAMAHCALGRCLKSSDPEGAVAALDEAFALAAPVQNNWLTGIARMESAAVTAAHGDPAAAAGQLLEVLDHWSQAGPGAGAQHWYCLRYVILLLERAGADTAALRRARPGDDRFGGRPGAPGGLETMTLARSGLQRLLTP